MINRQELREQIPYGYIAVIAEKASVTRKAVNDYFIGRTNSQKVELAALEVASDLNKRRNELLSHISTNQTNSNERAA